MTRSVLVTGGAGYVGSHACKALADSGYLPVTYDDLSTGNYWAVRWGPLELGDVCDASRLGQVIRHHAPVAVMHFAARSLVGESMSDPALYYRKNVGGGIVLLDACRSHGIEVLIFSSSCAVYGVPAETPIAEDCATAPLSPYGRSKLMIEQMLADHGAQYGLRHVCLRYFNAAGADPEGEIGECRDVETHLIPLMLDALAGRGPMLKIMGADYPTRDGTAIRDYVHVSDLADAHVRSLDHLLASGESRTINLGTGSGYSVKEVIDVAERVTGRKLPHVVAERRPGDPPELVAATAESENVLGANLTPRSGLDTILRDAWAWHLSGVGSVAATGR